MEGSELSLEFESVTKCYGTQRALDGLTLTVPQGSVTGFVGANGAGKTTAMRIGLGVLAADTGTVHWNGERITRLTGRRFGYSPEERGVYPRMRVLDFLVHFARLHGASRTDAQSRSRELLEGFGLANRERDRIETLSLGNQQRVQLAMALVHDPELLLLDEPFSGLDPTVTDELIELLRAEATRGVAVLFSSHALGIVESVSDRVAIITRGKLVVQGTLAELRAGLHSVRRYRIEVRGAAPGWEARVPDARRVDSVAGQQVFEVSDDRAAERLLQAALSSGQLISFHPEQPSLSSLYRSYIAR